jgi:hypothetical protein
MKQQNLIFTNMQSPGTCIFANRDEWSLEIVKEPRKSCIEGFKLRNDLRRILPGQCHWVSGVWVTKVDQVHKAVRYRFEGKRQYTFEEAIEIIESIREAKSA